MNFQFLKGDCCPTCGASVVIEESVEVDRYGQNPKVREHVAGGKWEKRKFICGQLLEYSPNFRQTEVSDRYVCQNNPAIIEKKKKREQAKSDVIAFINTISDVDDDFKNQMLREIETMYMS